MNKILGVRKCLVSFNDRSASLFLALLLLGDVFYFIIHTINMLTPPRNPLLHIGTDGGYAEYYQYIKFFWIVVLLIYLSWKDGSLRFTAWAMMFIYFLADDSLQFHERGGKFIFVNFDFVPPFGLGLRDFGELAISAIAGIILFVPLIWAYWSGSERFRKTSKDFILLIFVMLFFGIGVDSANQFFDFRKALNYVGVMLEDGGEMVSVSIIAWYVVLLNVRNANSDNYLVDCILGLFKKRTN